MGSNHLPCTVYHTSGNVPDSADQLTRDVSPMRLAC